MAAQVAAGGMVGNKTLSEIMLAQQTGVSMVAQQAGAGMAA